MKLVELLAKHYDKWPEGIRQICQSAHDTELYVEPHAGYDSQDHLVDWWAEDAGLQNYVDEAQWQAERDKQKGGEWKRHRAGRKQPVPDRIKIEVKFRDGEVHTVMSDRVDWIHYGRGSDLMQYRVISQPQAEEVEVNAYLGDSVKLEISHDGVNFIEIGTARIDNICDLGPAEAQWQQSTGPLAWRDTIIHCQAIIEDCEREIERNVALLDSEGLLMQLNAKKAMQAYDVPAVDMGDWRNWKEGDIVSVANDVDVDDGEYAIIEIEHSEYEGDMPVKTSKGWPDIEYATVEFIRRP